MKKYKYESNNFFLALDTIRLLCLLLYGRRPKLDNIISDVATAPVKLSLGMTPMQENGSMTRVCGENSLDLVLGEEMGKVADSAETRAETLTDAQENVVNDICVFQFANSDGKLKYSEYIQLTSSKLTADISLAAR